MRDNERMVIGARRHEPVHVRVTGHYVFAVSTPGYAWALGKPRQELVAWLSRKRIPWHCFNFRGRRGDVWYHETDFTGTA